MNDQIRRAYEDLNDDDKAIFWEELATALKWRGCDSRPGGRQAARSATNLYRIAGLLEDKGKLSIEEYT